MTFLNPGVVIFSTFYNLSYSPNLLVRLCLTQAALLQILQRSRDVFGHRRLVGTAAQVPEYAAIPSHLAALEQKTVP